MLLEVKLELKLVIEMNITTVLTIMNPLGIVDKLFGKDNNIVVMFIFMNQCMVYGILNGEMVIFGIVIGLIGIVVSLQSQNNFLSLIKKL
jgi:hypothetical protein